MNTVHRKESKKNRKREHSLTAIQSAFCSLLKNKSLDQISVTEICKCADINRSTFYANYVDIYDLSEKMIAEFSEKFSAVIQQYPYLDELDYYRKLLEFLDNTEFSEVMFLVPVKAISEKYLEFMYQETSRFQELSEQDREYFSLCHRYCQEGTTKLIRQWFLNGKSPAPDKMAEYLCRMNTAVIGSVNADGEFRKQVLSLKL